MDLIQFLLALGATARITRFVTSDLLGQPIRATVERRFGDDSRAAYLMTCPWCASIWISAAVLAAALLLPGLWFTAAAAWLTISYLYGLTASLLDD